MIRQVCQNYPGVTPADLGRMTLGAIKEVYLTPAKDDAALDYDDLLDAARGR